MASGIELNSTSLLDDANLQGYWRLENANDTSDNSYNLTGTAPSYVSAKFSNGGDFESGSSNYLNIADASCANLEISGSQTWCGWIKAESIAQMAVMGKSDSGATAWAGLYVNVTTGTVGFNLNGLTGAQITSDVAIVAGSWYFVAGVYDSSAGLNKVFVNGTKKEAVASGTHTHSDGDFSIGRLGAFSSNWYFDGVIDDCAIFNRALTDTEINALYYSGLLKDGDWSAPYQIDSDPTKVSGSSNLTN